MPEGPEIRIAADGIARALVGRTASRVYFAFEHLAPLAPLLAGEEVVSVRPRGKALLSHFANGLVIYSHNQLYGRWYVRKSGSVPVTRRQLRLAIHNCEKSALLYSASEIDVLEADRLEEHPFLARLGPDVLDLAEQDDGVAQVRERLGERRFTRRQLGALLLDQGFLAGLGNYLRAEILFCAGLHPLKRPMDCSPDELDALAEHCVRVTEQAYRLRGVTNDPERVAELKRRGLSRSRYRFHVFARVGERCWQCRTVIRKSEVSGRRCYVCPKCQPR